VSTPSRSKLALVALGAVLAAFYVELAALGSPGIAPVANRTDTLAFYCGARVAAAGDDPYRAGPLRACEHRAQRDVGITPIANLVVPAPLPGYDFALLRPLGAMPYRTALTAWYVLLLLAVATTVPLLARLTQTVPLLVALALFGADAFASISLGQMVPLVVLALVACAAALRAKRPQLAAAFAAGMLVEPHLGLPVVLALAIGVPRTRAVLVVAAIVLAGVSFLTLGVERNLEYLMAVLPAQARGEGLEFHRQYSLSALLHLAGVSIESAVRMGSLSYAAAIAGGVWLARRCARAFDDPAFLTCVPAAVALVGGAYVHIAQMAVALPLALLLASHTRGTRRAIAIAAACCLAIPWQSVFAQTTIAGLFPAGPYLDATPLLAHVAGGARLAEDPWDAWIATIANYDHRTVAEILLGKLPTWFGLAACVAIAHGAALYVERNRRAPR